MKEETNEIINCLTGILLFPIGMPTALLFSLAYLSQFKSSETEYSEVLHGDAVVSDVIPRDYVVAFESSLGEFRVRDRYDSEHHNSLWKRMKEGQNVDISYREIYRAQYGEDRNCDGKEDLIYRKLVDYDFIDAVPK